MDLSFSYEPVRRLSPVLEPRHLHVNPHPARGSAIISCVAGALAAVALFFGALFQSPLLLAAGCVSAFIAWWNYPRNEDVAPPRPVPLRGHAPLFVPREPNPSPLRRSPLYAGNQGAGPSSLPPLYSPPREILQQGFGDFMHLHNLNLNEAPPPYQAPHARQATGSRVPADAVHILIDQHNQGTPPPLGQRASMGTPVPHVGQAVPQVPAPSSSSSSSSTMNRSRIPADARRVEIIRVTQQVASDPAANVHAPVFVANRPVQPTPSMPAPSAPQMPAPSASFGTSAPSSTMNRSRVAADAQRVEIDQSHQGTPPEDPRHNGSANPRSTANRSRRAPD